MNIFDAEKFTKVHLSRIERLKGEIESGNERTAHNLANRIRRERKLYAAKGGVLTKRLMVIDKEFELIARRFYDKPTAKKMHELRSYGFVGGYYDLSREDANRWIRERKFELLEEKARIAIMGRIARFGKAEKGDFPHYPAAFVEAIINDLEASQ